MKIPLFDRCDFCVMGLESFMQRVGLLDGSLPMMTTIRFVEKYHDCN